MQVLLFVLGCMMAMVAAACDGDDGAVVHFDGEPTGPTQPATRSPGNSPTQPNGNTTAPAGSPTSTPLPDYGEVLPCGDILVPVNKEQRLPEDCAPDDLVAIPAELTDGEQRLLRAEPAAALEQMLGAAREAGHEIVVTSAYRSYETQVQTFNYWVETLGREQAERTSAQPGHSEHQLGTTVDVSSASVGYQLTEEFGATPEGQWIAENSWRFGFVITYPEGSEPITGYAYEPWHLRYVGEDVARQVHETGLTLHEFLQR